MENGVYCMDAAEGTKKLEDNSIQLSIFSPPYNLDKNYDKSYNDRRPIEEWKSMMNEVFEELFRVVKPDGKVAVNIGKSYSSKDDKGRFFQYPLHSYIINIGLNVGFDFYDEIIWEKNTFSNSGGGALLGSYPYPTNFMINQNHEYIIIFRKWVSEEYYSNREIPQKGTDKRENSAISKEEWREYTDSIWEISGVNQSNLDIDHNAVFPVEIPKRLIKLYSFVGDTILDPFVGTGSTWEAAFKNNRDFVGFDINEQYIKYSKKRMKKY